VSELRIFWPFYVKTTWRRMIALSRIRLTELFWQIFSKRKFGGEYG